MERNDNETVLSRLFGIHSDDSAKLTQLMEMCYDALGAFGVLNDENDQYAVDERFRDSMRKNMQNFDNMTEGIRYGILEAATDCLADTPYSDYHFIFQNGLMSDSYYPDPYALYINDKPYVMGTAPQDYEKDVTLEFGDNADLYGRESLSYEEFYNLSEFMSSFTDNPRAELKDEPIRVQFSANFSELCERMIASYDNTDAFRAFNEFMDKDPDGTAIIIAKNVGYESDKPKVLAKISFAEIVDKADEIPCARDWSLEVKDNDLYKSLAAMMNDKMAEAKKSLTKKDIERNDD